MFMSQLLLQGLSFTKIGCSAGEISVLESLGNYLFVLVGSILLASPEYKHFKQRLQQELSNKEGLTSTGR